MIFRHLQSTIAEHAPGRSGSLDKAAVYTVFGNGNHFIAGISAAQRHPYRTGSHETDAFCSGVVVHVGMPGEDHVNSVLLEKR